MTDSLTFSFIKSIIIWQKLEWNRLSGRLIYCMLTYNYSHICRLTYNWSDHLKEGNISNNHELIVDYLEVKVKLSCQYQQ